MIPRDGTDLRWRLPRDGSSPRAMTKGSAGGDSELGTRGGRLDLSELRFQAQRHGNRFASQANDNPPSFADFNVSAGNSGIPTRKGRHH